MRIFGHFYHIIDRPLVTSRLPWLAGLAKKRGNNIMRTPLIGLFIAASVFQSYALAQAVLEEIVVTAQRREQNLQEVPVSVTAFSGTQLQELGITEAVQYLSLSPNVSFTEDGQTGSRGISISMRGISNINTDESAFIQSIGIYLDEFSVASTANSTINLQLQDLERVEILRGPQGTYFGRNAVGGALNLTTKKPHDELEGEIIFGAQDYETRGSQWGVTGIMNLPVTENFWLRGVGYIEDNSGIVKNIVPDGGDSGHEYYMGRVSARWIVSDKTTVDLMGMYSNEDQGVDENVPSGVWDTDTVATFFLNDPAGTAFPAPLDDGTGFWPNNRSEIAHTAIGEKNENRAALGVLKIEHQWREDIVIKSITGYIHTEREKIFDNDLTPEDLVNRYEGREGDSWSTELRFEMTREKFDWTFGFLYAEDDVKDDPDADQPGGGLGVVTGVTTAVDGGVSLTPVPCGPQPCTPNTTIPIVGPGIVDFALTGSLPPLFDLSGGAAPGGIFLWQVAGGTGTPDGLPPLCLGCSIRKNSLDAFAIFSDWTWHATDQLDLTFGFRYTHDDVFAKFTGFGLNRFPRIADPSDPTGATPVSWDNSEVFNNFSPRFVIGWQWNDDVRLYANVSKGYKAGGFSLDFNSAGGAPNQGIVNEPFKEETLWNYEIGIKSEWFDRRLRVNAAAFFVDWSDLQLETFFFTVPGDATSNIQLTINVEEAEALGFEVEIAAAPTDRLTLTGGIGYLDTEIESNDFARISGNLSVGLQGVDLPRSPEWSLNATADYRWPWETHELYVRGEWIFKDSQFSTIEDTTFEETSGIAIPIDPSMPATGANVAARVPDRSDGFPFRTPDYHLVNLRAGVAWDEKISLNAFVVNVFDEEYYSGTGENFGLSGFRLRPHPRYFGGSLSYKFF